MITNFRVNTFNYFYLRFIYLNIHLVERQAISEYLPLYGMNLNLNKREINKKCVLFRLRFIPYIGRYYDISKKDKNKLLCQA